MSSRREEKERRRLERLENERAQAAVAARKRRVVYAVGGLVCVLVLVGFGVLGARALDTETSAGGGISAGGLPSQRTDDVKTAAERAGCKLDEMPNEGAGHEEKDFAAADYESNPPTSGTHAPDWYADGIYAPGDTPELGKLVHTLEHGRVNVQYRRGTPATTTQRLEALVNEQDGGYHMLLHENGTDMQFAVAATAWDQRLGCPTMNDAVFDALRTFRTDYIDKGPEVVP